MSTCARHNGKTTTVHENDTASSPVGLTVRPAHQTDAVPLAFFLDTTLRKDYFMRRGQLDDILHSPYHQVFVAEIDAILVGVVITTRGTRLVNALVHPGYRRLGIGRALIGYSGASEVRAKLDMSSGDPRGFYTALGFESTGRTNDKGTIEVMRLRKRRAQPTSAKPHVSKAG